MKRFIVLSISDVKTAKNSCQYIVIRIQGENDKTIVTMSDIIPPKTYTYCVFESNQPNLFAKLLKIIEQRLPLPVIVGHMTTILGISNIPIHCFKPKCVE
jgi:hypothetical protein